MIAKIIITIILIIFFSGSVITFIAGLRSFMKDDEKFKKDKMLLIVLFISAAFSGYALIEFIKMLS